MKNEHCRVHEKSLLAGSTYRQTFSTILILFPNGRQVKIFERESMEIKPGDKYKNAFDISLGVLKEAK